MAKNNANNIAAQDKVTVQRRFVKVGSRLVHYRTAGSGPPIVLIHQSPKSSAELIGMIRQLATNFTVFAPDTPGYGYSDPLANTNAGIDDFVDALAVLFDTLGLHKPTVFGSHSGAIFGVRFAARYPHKISALVANGILINDQTTRDDLVANYFPDFAPDWEGSHLPRVWSRIRDQHCYYPWYRRSPATRIHWPASIDEMHESAMEILRAGEHYKTGYRAVLDYDITPDLTRLTVPTLLVVAEGDALVHYVPFYPPLADSTEVKVVAEFSDIPLATAAFARAHGTGCGLAIPLAGNDKCRSGRQLLNLGSGAIHYITAGDYRQPAVLILHDIGQSAARYTPLISLLAQDYFVIAPDLPGHGMSDDFGSEARVISHALDGLLAANEITECAIIAMGNSQGYATLLAAEGEITLIKLVSVGRNNTAVVPDLTVDFAGTQLLKAWYWERDKTLFSPWQCHSENTMLPMVESITPALLQQRMLDSLISARVANAQLKDLALTNNHLPSPVTPQVVESDESAGDWHWLLQALQA
ncbi:alpha/beta fold hydrolase [Alteromonas lipolytica]|uniref:alpha/beta fold hydrolase n=1 Tax=Alteromonas lipolytica TaxID=1856405 RepID=UPI0008727536|nr:alpha/beta fold hydrolase [Alteromonas lipolytica]